MSEFMGKARANFLISPELLGLCKSEAERQGTSLTGLIIQALTETITRRATTLELMRLEHLPEWARRPMVVAEAPKLADPHPLNEPLVPPAPAESHDSLDSRLL